MMHQSVNHGANFEFNTSSKILDSESAGNLCFYLRGLLKHRWPLFEACISE